MTWAEAPSAPRFEHRTDLGAVLGINTATPRLSWFVPAADADYSQTAAEIEVVRGGVATVYPVSGPEQVLVPWPGSPLQSRESASVRIRVAHDQHWSDWSSPGAVEAGLFHPADWQAQFITPTRVGAESTPAPILAASIDAPDRVVSARLYATAHGVYTATLNGQRVGDEVLAPGWTSYSHRLRYQVYDVTSHITPGHNALEFKLGNGWYRGRLGYEGARALYGDKLALLAQLEVTTADGSTLILGTDGTWTARESEILADDLYDGQRTDLRRVGQASPPSPVKILDDDLTRLVAPDGPPIRATQVLPALHVWTSTNGRTLIDFGQNAVGWIRLKVRNLQAGSEVVIRHAEMLEGDGLALRPLRNAAATDTYITAGAPEELLEPEFTFHGFRYAEVQGVPDVRPEDLEMVVIGSDLTRTGTFSTSHELLDRLHENVLWSMRGNFIDVPIDCPQRDERLGWTGDIQVFAPTASFLFDTAGFLTSWLADLASEQRADGAVPHVVPVVETALSWLPAAAWGDAATFVPWTLYQRTGDLGILARQYDSMKAWVSKVTDVAGPDLVWSGGFQYGDWLDPTAPPEAPGRGQTNPDLVATAHFVRSAEIVAATARLLDRDDDAAKYTLLADSVRSAFASHFVTPSGLVISDSTTAYALALQWSLLPTRAQQKEAGERLADLVRRTGFRISTGFVGTPLICDALVAAGHPDVAHRLLLQTQCPSWLYPVTMGATTIWERWDSLRPDGSINPGEMTSFNHYALGAIADFLHRSVAGLAPLTPGYRELEVRPVPPTDLKWAAASHQTPYGRASVRWERLNGSIDLKLQVPVGATARVYLPFTDEAITVGHGEHQWSVPDRSPRAGNHQNQATIRDVVDDSALWKLLEELALDAGIATDDVHLAEQLSPYLDAPARFTSKALTPDERQPGVHHFRRSADGIIDRFAS
ncbi:glycoside hydrolase family 78 protein [Arthrobacter burdickii]|uniref:alpha-L-rhamnosidase n=1 Tax=Arthrobacter burdickii TaxID=3035920 RepID=A0ABT8JXF8_9MICC|nr:glycoside hydrolase family 78 protein [Arthrobacter burdickii]MDN4609861.1 glycoside hydrolase family 78 protein [Arthrobacter burdickii]